MLLIGCHPKHPTTVPARSPQELFEQGLEHLERKRYELAIRAFQQITLEYATTKYAADAQFYLAESYLGAKNYAQAQIEYEFLTTNYPTSPFYEEALYKTALCVFRQAPRAALDQSNVVKAREQLELFRERFPNSRWLPEVARLEGELLSRLAEKEYQAGLLYARAGEYESAKVYFLHIIESYPSIALIPQVRFQLAVCYENTNDVARAREIYEELSTGSYDISLKQLAAGRLARLR